MPTGKLFITVEQLPAPSNVQFPIALAPSLNVMTPVGTPLLPLNEAEKVTAVPKSVGELGVEVAVNVAEGFAMLF